MNTLGARCTEIRARIGLPSSGCGTAFTLDVAVFLPSHVAQKPRATGAVQNTCIITMAMMQASHPAPGRSLPSYVN